MPSSAAAAERPFLVVFDTSTHAEFYSDVHRVLALPAGAVVSYDYKRSLMTPAAGRVFDQLIEKSAPLPVDVLLLYGEKKTFKKGQADPTTMLTRADSVFVPTRVARIVSVSHTKGAQAPTDVFQFFLQMRGFIDPSAGVVDEVVAALEAENALPFGDRATQYSWVSTLPAALRGRASALITDNQDHWSSVVDQLVTKNTQFSDDVFWRIMSVRKVARRAVVDGALPLRDRGTNIAGDATMWNRDYRLGELNTYELSVQTHTTSGRSFPDGVSLAVIPSGGVEGALKLDPEPTTLRRENTASQTFSTLASAAPKARHARVRLETQIPGWTSNYPAGSTCTVTFGVRKQIWRWMVGIVCVVGAVALLGVLKDLHAKPLVAAGLIALAAVACGVGWWAWNGQFKLGKG